MEKNMHARFPGAEQTLVYTMSLGKKSVVLKEFTLAVDKGSGKR